MWILMATLSPALIFSCMPAPLNTSIILITRLSWAPAARSSIYQTFARSPIGRPPFVSQKFRTPKKLTPGILSKLKGKWFDGFVVSLLFSHRRLCAYYDEQLSYRLGLD